MEAVLQAAKRFGVGGLQGQSKVAWSVCFGAAMGQPVRDLSLWQLELWLASVNLLSELRADHGRPPFGGWHYEEHTWHYDIGGDDAETHPAYAEISAQYERGETIHAAEQLIAYAQWCMTRTPPVDPDQASSKQRYAVEVPF